jgi:phytoene dehydrogenase-like protein
MQPLVDDFDALMDGLLAPIGVAGLKHPWVMASFGLKGIRSASGLAAHVFQSSAARAMFAGAAAHSLVPLSFAGTAGYGLGLVLSAHAVGWPVVRGGAQRAADAMASYFQSLGGEIVTGQRVTSLRELPASRVVLCDVPPRALVQLAGDRLPARYRRTLERFRHGPGVFKMDWTLNAPVPWRAAVCRRAGTLHLGGTLEEIAASEDDAWRGRVSARPYVLVVQPTVFDPTRAPHGRHTLWAYCHVPHGSSVDRTAAIEAQIERFAPGFRDTIVARSATGPAALEARNANLVGGDIAGGAADLAQIIRRPVIGPNPYATPVPGLFLCSSSTPPGVGVHGMCGFHAAQSALAYLERGGVR